MQCKAGGEHELFEVKGKIDDEDDDEEELEDEELAEDWGFDPNDYEKTMGLDQDPDWEESFDFDDIGEGD